MNSNIDPGSLKTLSYGLYLVTSCYEGKLGGQVANAVFQITSNPPQIAISMNKTELTHEYISRSKVFAVCVLDESTPMTLIGLFGFKSGRDIDKLSRVPFKEGVNGCPIVTDEHILAVLEAKVINQVDVGTHTLFIGELISGEVLRQGKPLTYSFYHEHLRGKTPKTAATYVEEKEQASEKSRPVMQKYICNVCGYIYDPAAGDPEDGVTPGTAFEDLPEEWVCPVCGAAKNEFSPID